MKFFFIYLILINIAGLLCFWTDKYRAVRNKWRIRESTLFLLALLGGGAGCLAGMYLFHHKTRHKKFTIGIPVILTVELLLGCSLYLYFEQRTPYTQDPKKLIQHELSLLKSADFASLEEYISYQDIFPAEDTDKTIPDDIKSIFTDFFKNFSYKIKDVEEAKDSAKVTVQLTTLNGKQLAKEYSRRALVKQIQNSATPSNVEFSLEDCYLLLGNVLTDNNLETVTFDYTVELTCNSENIWSVVHPGDVKSALTDNFAAYVSDADLFTPSEILSIHLDTLKSFDTEQLNRYLALDNLFPGDAEYKRTISRALASQLLSYLDYSITSETVSPDQTSAAVEMDLTSCDCRSMMEKYKEQVMQYTGTAQALQDGISGRLTKANEFLVACISENTASAATHITINLTNDGANWKLEMNDEMSDALLGNISEAVQEVSNQLQS